MSNKGEKEYSLNRDDRATLHILTIHLYNCSRVCECFYKGILTFIH